MTQKEITDTAVMETALARIKRKDAQKMRAGFAREILRKHRLAIRHANRAKTAMELAIQAAFECGRLLSEQQKQLGRKGNFDAWCGEFLPRIERRTIYRYKALFEQVAQYLEARGDDPNKVTHVSLSGLNFASLRQLYIAFGILPEHETNDEQKPSRSFLDPLLRVLGSSRFEALKDEQTLDRLSRDELFMLNRTLEPFLAIKSRIETRLAEENG